MSNPTRFPELNVVLRELTERVTSTLGEACVGVYLQGSFALGDPDEHSDVDFVVAISKALAHPWRSDRPSPAPVTIEPTSHE